MVKLTSLPVDAMPVNITTVVLTSNAVVLSWVRPSLTVGDGMMFGHYNVSSLWLTVRVFVLSWLPVLV